MDGARVKLKANNGEKWMIDFPGKGGGEVKVYRLVWYFIPVRVKVLTPAGAKALADLAKKFPSLVNPILERESKSLSAFVNVDTRHSEK